MAPLLGPKVGPLVLNVNTSQYHQLVQYRITTTKVVQPQDEQQDFAGLCQAMDANNVEGFAFLCQALQESDTPLALSVLDPATGEFLEHRQLLCDPRYKTTWDTSYTNELG